MNKIYVLLGPTASGKTEISIELAKKINAEIISADSRQVYKHIQIATCAPTNNEILAIKHYFVNELELHEEFNAGLFAKKAKLIIKDIFDKGKNVLVVGGSGLYIKSLIDGFYEEDINDPELRKLLNSRLLSEGKDSLYNELMNLDPEIALKMDSSKFRRVIRALEVFYSTGKKMSELQKLNIKPDFDAIQIGLLTERNVLYDRINSRVDALISSGLIEEVESILNKGLNYHTHNSLNTVGIKEVFQYLQGDFDKSTMISKIKQNTRRYAKRQLTWFNADKRIIWVNHNSKIIDKIINEIYIN